MNSGLMVMARKEAWTLGVGLCFGMKEGGRIMVAQPLVFKEVPAGSHIDPAIDLDGTTAQKLMDELWDCGIRPSEGTGSAGAFAAQGKHLEDMRRIVFKEDTDQ